jgi:hypothetical protein
MAKRKPKIENGWKFNGEVFDGPIEDWYGFIYLIEEHKTGKKYVGEKSFWTFRVPKGMKNKKKSESNWKVYPSSNKVLSAAIKASGDKLKDYSFTILALCADKGIMKYTEILWMCKLGALHDDNFYNENMHINIMTTYKDFDSRVLQSNFSL